MRDGRRFTAEDLRSAVNTRMMADGFVPAHTICAPGDQAVDPHEGGHGPIRANQPVVMDIFPRSEATGYFGDLTRTVVRGKASFALHELYAIVHEGVRLGHRMLRDGVEGDGDPPRDPAPLRAPGHTTGVRNGRMQGFFHGTGHGLGLEIHEAPSIGKRPVRAAGGARGDGGARALLPRPRGRADRGRGARDEDGVALPHARAEAARDLRRLRGRRQRPGLRLGSLRALRAAGDPRAGGRAAAARARSRGPRARHPGGAAVLRRRLLAEPRERRAAAVPGARRPGRRRRCCGPACASPRIGRRCGARCRPSPCWWRCWRARSTARTAWTRTGAFALDVGEHVDTALHVGVDVGARRLVPAAGARPGRRRRCGTTWAATWCGPPRCAGRASIPTTRSSRFDVTLWGIALVLALRAAAHALGLGRGRGAARRLPPARRRPVVRAGAAARRRPNAAVKLGGNFVEAVLFANSISPAMAAVLAALVALERAERGRGPRLRGPRGLARGRGLVPEGVHGRAAAARVRPGLARPAHAARRSWPSRRRSRSRSRSWRSARWRPRAARESGSRSCPSRPRTRRASRSASSPRRPRARAVGARLARALARPARGRRAAGARALCARAARPRRASGRSRSAGWPIALFVSVTADPAYDESFYFLQASGLAALPAGDAGARSRGRAARRLARGRCLLLALPATAELVVRRAARSSRSGSAAPTVRAMAALRAASCPGDVVLDAARGRAGAAGRGARRAARAARELHPVLAPVHDARGGGRARGDGARLLPRAGRAGRARRGARAGGPLRVLRRAQVEPRCPPRTTRPPAGRSGAAAGRRAPRARARRAARGGLPVQGRAGGDRLPGGLRSRE